MTWKDIGDAWTLIMIAIIILGSAALGCVNRHKDK
jgi:hypothetical protein